MPGLRKLLKWIAVPVGLWLLFQLGKLLLLLFPQPAFSYRLEYQNYRIYSDAPLDSTIQALFDDVEQRNRAIPIYQPGKIWTVFLCRDLERYGFYAELSGLAKFSQGFNLVLANRIFISLTFIESVHARFGPASRHSLLEGSAAHIISHEIFHSCIAETLGFWRARALPSWKVEGYAEYAATRHAIRSDSSDSFRARLSRLFEPGFLAAYPLRRHYYQSQLLVEFLSEVKGLNFAAIMGDGTNEAETLEALRAWYNSNSD